jgi:heme A synthase
MQDLTSDPGTAWAGPSAAPVMVRFATRCCCQGRKHGGVRPGDAAVANSRIGAGDDRSPVHILSGVLTTIGLALIIVAAASRRRVVRESAFVAAVVALAMFIVIVTGALIRGIL